MTNKYSSKDITFWKPLLELIKRAEATRSDPYNSVEGTKPYPGLQKLKISDAIQKSSATHIGAYQFDKKKGLPKWVPAIGLNLTDDIFNQDNQDSLAIYLIEDSGGSSWKNGPTTTETFMLNLAKVWAGLPVPFDTGRPSGVDTIKIKKGESYYTGVKTNRSTVTLYEFYTALSPINPDKVSKIDEVEIKLAPSPSPPVSVTIIESEYLQYIQTDIDDK
jgi:hypothetical protein